MVQEANVKRAQAEKSFVESEMKVGDSQIFQNGYINACLTLVSGRMMLLQCCIINFTQQNCWQLQLVKLTLQHDQANLS